MSLLELSKKVFQCSRCKQIVKEINNIGQWECESYKVIYGKRYHIYCDHGQSSEMPHFEITLAEFNKLPTPKHKSAILGYKKVKRGHKIQTIVVIARSQQLSEFDDRVLPDFNKSMYS